SRLSTGRSPMRRAMLAIVVLWLCQSGASAQTRKTLDIYFVDVEGGQATLIVTPAGESFLVDTGRDTPDARDAKRIMAAVHDAGVSQIDYLMITHFHSDHDGAVPDLAKLIPIKTFIDYGGPTERSNKVIRPYAAYSRVRRRGAHLQPNVGDVLPIKGVDVQI